ncbi:hypothetical protein [Treponema peruense]|uniref:Uncharacterized protein n=1 Tax=Treponema peruense TaxID=2787628 RepID=A0A7T3V6L9_9SPIR|nr:hypothetical protein [Treponema peruense]QQA02140.1 hypothetical protein IWA51_06065 [Treponema peruense]
MKKTLFFNPQQLTITQHLISEGIKTLKSLSQKIGTTKMKEPSFLMVLTAVGDYAYKREDGILVVPICCLKN